MRALGGVGSPREDERVATYALWAIGNLVQLGRDSGLVADTPMPSLAGGFKQGLGSAVGIASGGSARNTQRLGEAGVVQAVVAAAARHADSPLVLRWACRAVYNLARSKTLRAQFNVLKARWTMEQIAETYAADRGLNEWALMAADVLQNGVPLPAPPSADKRALDMSSSSGGGSPRTSFSALQSLSSGMSAMVGAIDDSLGMGSAEKGKKVAAGGGLSKGRSKSLSAKEAEADLEAAGNTGLSPRRGMSVAPVNRCPPRPTHPPPFQSPTSHIPLPRLRLERSS